MAHPLIKAVEDILSDPPTEGVVSNQPSDPDLLAKEGVAELLDMLTYKRVAGSQTEEDFITKFLGPFNPTRDAYGNHIVVIGDSPKILWSAHTDTVHHTEGRQNVYMDGVMVKVKIERVKRYRTDARTGKRYSKRVKNTNCLGADNGAGVWLLIEMMKAKQPGIYIFHRDEESGGGGSKFIATLYPDFLKTIEFAIAFDRKGYSDVITHQGGSRTASDAFARQVAAILGGSYIPDDSGVFTDTECYKDVIGECTNISMGYFNGHGPTECLDLDFIVKLRDVIVAADWSTLQAFRKPGESENKWWDDYGSARYDTRNWSNDPPMTNSEWDAYLKDKYGEDMVKSFRDDYGDTVKDVIRQPYDDGYRSARRWHSLEGFIKDHPEIIASILEDHGYDLDAVLMYANQLIDIERVY